MVKTTVKIDGMACGMCEAHVCDAIRKTFPDAKKVAASHRRNEATFVTDAPVDAGALKSAIDALGYRYMGASGEPYVTKGFLWW